MAVAGLGCAGHAGRADGPAAPTTPGVVETWPDATRSPWRIETAELPARERALTEACGTADAALARAAARLARERVDDPEPHPDPDRVITLLRAEGEPHVRPRVVLARGTPPVDDAATLTELARGRRAETRCGVGVARGKAQELVVAVTVEAVADLDPLPIRARVGQWLTFAAALHVAAQDAKLVVLGPRGLPRTVATTFDAGSGTARARFVLDRPGAFDVQLVGDLETGPEPLLEARVFSDVEPPSSAPGAAAPAPGEEDGDDAEALARMTATLRETEGATALARDPRLDALAQAHAEAMRTKRTLAHDVGDGNIVSRAEAAGLHAWLFGENVARAGSVRLAFRALYESPSHRLNLLRAEYTHIGVGVANGPDGNVFVCQTFARRRRRRAERD